MLHLRSVLLLLCLGLMTSFSLQAQTLDEQLQREPLTDLAEAAHKNGDAARGAILFFQQHMACSKCHAVGESKPNMLGPDLAALGKEVKDTELIEAVLLPSKTIRKGFETITLHLHDGKSLTGLLVEQTKDAIKIRDAARGGEVITIARSEIDELKLSPLSIMPAAQVNQLASRQQFLDLIRYLQEVRDGGAKRARELQPSPTLLVFNVPEYESRLDHAGFIKTWNAASLKRGEAIYQRVCANCHGTKDRPGSLPNSLRFAEGKFKNGSDPLSMYHTLTRGFGFMTPQTWMVPSQKYDVIHYIRETYLRPHNPTQFVEVNEAYLAKLPKGDTRGPEPSKIEPWSAMDYGSNLTHTYEIPGAKHNFAYKGIAVRLDPGAGGVSRGKEWLVFDTDTLRVAAAWSAQDKADEKFIDYRGIQFNGQHQIHPKIVGSVRYANSTGPGWANPANGSFQDDQRVLGRDGKRYGPLPRAWGRYRGLYQHGQQVVLSYDVGSTSILESPRYLANEQSPESPWILRTFNIGSRDRELVLKIAEGNGEQTWKVEGSNVRGQAIKQSKQLPLLAGVAPASTSLEWLVADEELRLRIPAGKEPFRFSVWTTNSANAASAPTIADADLDLTAFTNGGPPRWSQTLTTAITAGAETGPFAVDFLNAPEVNPWLAQTRFTGLDFFADGRVAICTWDGDVWIVSSPISSNELRWQRIATGLFQPLGLKIVNEKIHVICRDQLAILHDLNGDGETDFYECLNNDHQVTEHFHEFAMGLQTDAAGNFYYAKSGRHALKAVVPHHGTLLKISRDGTKTEILANGFRAANGVCLNPDGSFVVTDQEGHWNPKNRINWVTLDPSGKPKFYGNMFGYHDVTDDSDSAMEPPLCWITNAFDRSPAELLWVNSERWGKLNGSLLNLSYGYGKVFLVPHEKVNGKMQGGMIELPIPAFPTGVMRGRFHPADGQLYLCGMFAWAGNATKPGGFYRLRATGKPPYLPLELHATKTGITLNFTDPLDPKSIDPKNAAVKVWSLKRTANYGSKHHDEHPLTIQSAKLSTDGKTLTLGIPDIQPTWCMEIKYEFQSADGKPVTGVINNTIHALGE